MLQKLQIYPCYTAHKKNSSKKTRTHCTFTIWWKLWSKAGKLYKPFVDGVKISIWVFFSWNTEKTFSKKQYSIAGVVNSQTGHSFAFPSIPFSNRVLHLNRRLTPHLNTIFQMKSNCVPGERTARKTSIDKHWKCFTESFFYWFTLDDVWDDLQERNIQWNLLLKRVYKISFFNLSLASFMCNFLRSF